MQRVLRNMGWLLGGRGINALLSLIYLALATRCLGLTGFGYFAIIVGLGQAITGLATFQTWQLIVRHGAHHGAAGDAIGFALALDGISIAAGTALAAFLLYGVPSWIGLPGDLGPIALGFCFISLLTIRSTPTGILRLHDRYGLATIAESATPVVRAIGAGLAAWLSPSIAGFLLVWALAEFASTFAYWLFAAREERPRLAAIGLRKLSSSGNSPWPFVWATNLSGSLSIVSRQILLVLVGAIGGPILAGGFRIASQLGFGMLKLAQAVSRAVYPELVRTNGDARALAHRMLLLSGAVGLMAVIAAALFGRWALGVIGGPAYVFAHLAMVLLAAGAAVEMAAASAEALLVAQGRVVLALAVRAIPTAASLALLPFAIERGGLTGAAICVLIGSALAFLGFVRAGRANAADAPEANSEVDSRSAPGPAR
jgi:O-antigen/teichoic acid export membrane protein